MDHSTTMRRAYELISGGDIDGFGRLVAAGFVEHEETPGLPPKLVELATLHQHYARLVQLARKDTDLRQSHSVDEATARHGRKASAAPRARTR